MEKKKPTTKRTTSDSKDKLDTIIELLNDIKSILSENLAKEKGLKSEDLFYGGH